MRKIEALSEPSPAQESSVNRSWVNGSTESTVLQVNPEETVCITSPLEGLICKTTPVLKLPPVTERLANRLPLESKTIPVRPSPIEVLLSLRGRACNTATGRELVHVAVHFVVRIQIPR